VRLETLSRAATSAIVNNGSTMIRHNAQKNWLTLDFPSQLNNGAVTTCGDAVRSISSRVAFYFSIIPKIPAIKRPSDAPTHDSHH
jgi:hypothetical protein